MDSNQMYYGQEPLQPPVFDQKSHRKHFSRIGFAYVAFIVISTLLGAIIGLVSEIIMPGITENHLFSIIANLVIMYGISAPILFIILKGVPADKPERRKWSFPQWIGGLFVTLFLVYLSNYIGTYIGMMIESIFPELKASTNSLQSFAMTGDVLINALYLVILGPIMEELVFRKLLCDRLRAYGDGVAVVVTGLLFGLTHGNLTQGVYAFTFGCFLAYIYLKTGNIFVTISYHMVLNFIGGVVSVLSLSGLDMDEFAEVFENGNAEAAGQYLMDHISQISGFILFLLFIMIAFVTGLIIMIVTFARGRVKFEQGKIFIPSGKKFSTVIVNPGMIAFIAVSIISVILAMLPQG